MLIKLIKKTTPYSSRRLERTISIRANEELLKIRVKNIMT
jgi:hypothetical protein